MLIVILFLFGGAIAGVLILRAKKFDYFLVRFADGKTLKCSNVVRHQCGLSFDGCEDGLSHDCTVNAQYSTGKN